MRSAGQQQALLGVSRNADTMTMTKAVSSMWGQVCGTINQLTYQLRLTL